MKNKKTFLSDDFIQFLVKNSGGFLSDKQIKNLLNIFSEEARKYHFISSSENNLRRIIENSFDKISLLAECLNFPHHAEIIVAIASSSNYLTDILVRNPEYLFRLFDQDYLWEIIETKTIRKELAELNERYKTYETKIKMLRLLKRRYILRIGLNDILGFYTLNTIVQQISLLARELLAQLFELSYQKTIQKYNLSTVRREYCLAGLGKLGGNELNYSSDVDLILFYDKNSKIGKEKKMDYFDILTETVQLFISESSSITSSGFLYRIDFRLRPDGRNSPLARTVGDYIRYYEIRGEDWERQMLIKLDYLAGSKKLYNSFAEYIKHYIYPSFLKNSPVEEIHKMKKVIEKKLIDDSDIKLFPGGIRDIEFSVQALQLINGGKNKNLQTGNTIEAILSLAEFNIISETEKEVFLEAYEFYRRIEHFLQLMNDRQTHSIPTDPEVKTKLAKYTGLKSEKQLLEKIEFLRKEVRKIFLSIMGEETDVLADSWDSISFRDKNAADKNSSYLKSGISISGVKEFDKSVISKFSKIEDKLIQFLQNSFDPDKVLNSFTNIIRSSHLPSIWYNEFQNERFFNDFLTIVQNSQKITEMLVTYPKLGEHLITKKALVRNIEKYFHGLNTDELRFILAVQFTLGLISHNQVSANISRFVKFKIDQIFESKKFDDEYFIGGLGSLGSEEIGLDSDIDLIFVVRKFSNYARVQNNFQEILQELKKLLSPFEVDCRLRPEGKKSPLVWELGSYLEYIKKRARIWELQSLLKLKFISGSENLFNSFIKEYHKRLRKIDLQEANAEIIQMRKALQKQIVSGIKQAHNLKRSSGGLSDIEFILSYLLFKTGKFSVRNEVNSTLKRLDFLRQELSPKEHNILTFNFDFLKNLEFTLQNLFAARSKTFPTDELKLDQLSYVLNLKPASELNSIYVKIIKQNSELFYKYFSFE